MRDRPLRVQPPTLRHGCPVVAIGSDERRVHHLLCVLRAAVRFQLRFAQEDHWLFEQIEGADAECSAMRDLRGPFDHAVSVRRRASRISRRATGDLAHDARAGGRAPHSDRPRTTLPLVELPARRTCKQLPARPPRRGSRSTRSPRRRSEPFDLSRGPLLRMTAGASLRAAEEHVLVVAVASRRLRRLVASDLLAGAFLSLYESRRKNVREPACAASRSIRRLCDLAARMAPRRSARP